MADTPDTGWPNPRNEKQIVDPNWLLKINQHSSPIPTRKISWVWSTKTHANTCKYPKSQAQTSLIFPDIPKRNHQGAMAIETLQANSILDPPNSGAAIVGTRGQQRGIHVEGHGHHGALVATQGQTTGTMLERPRSKSTWWQLNQQTMDLVVKLMVYGWFMAFRLWANIMDSTMGLN